VGQNIKLNLCSKNLDSMSDSINDYQSLLKLVLPSELFDYFEIINLIVSDNSIDVYLDEQNLKPIEFSDQKLTSKGFHSEIVVQDFPIRKRPVFLHVRRRRWLVEDTGKVISREWDSVAEGTRYTKSFADFLKGLFGQSPH
jgi:hypothetical protein